MRDPLCNNFYCASTIVMLEITREVCFMFRPTALYRLKLYQCQQNTKFHKSGYRKQQFFLMRCQVFLAVKIEIIMFLVITLFAVISGHLAERW